MKTNVFTILGVAVFFLIIASVIFSFVKSDSGDIGTTNSTIKSYDAITKTATLNSIEDDAIATIQLKSNLNEQVGLGYQKVFQYEIDSKTNYTNFIQELEIYNLKRSGTKENKQIDLKYLTYETIDVPDYEVTCKQSSCTTKEIGSYKEQREVWNDLSSMDMKEEKIIISGWTDVKQGDYYEWIPNFAGVKVNEWATWTGNLSNGLIAYYKFDETSGTNLADAVTGNYPATTYGGLSVNEIGKIGRSIRLDGSTGYAQINNSINFTTGYTMNFWYNADAVANAVFLNHREGGNWWLLKQDTTANGQIGLNWQTSNIVAVSSRTISTGAWRMLTYSYNGTYTCLLVDLTGACTAGTGTMSFPYSWTQIGKGGDGGDFVDGFMDELGFWNRSLSATELGYIYKDGTGCQYGDEFCFTAPPSTNCNFTGYVKDSAGNGLNGANVIIINQTDNKMYYNVTSDANGFWSKNITNSNGTASSQLFTVLAYFNNSLVGGIKPYVNSTCP